VTPDAIVKLLASLASVIAGIVAALANAQATIEEMLATARAAVPAPTGPSVEATIARHVATIHPQITHATADVLGRLIGPREGALLTSEERDAIRAAIPALRAIAEAREVPPVLDVPTGAWSEGPEGL
jgi:hypothetical protein